MSIADKLAKLLNDWGKTLSIYDLNKDNIVDATDLSMLLSGYDPEVIDPDPIGTPDDPGYDATAVARWTCVPFREIKQTAKIGVAAFHMNGIDRVEFSVNKGAWQVVREPALNTDNGVVEYFIEIDPSQHEDGTVEIYAVAYPRIGIPRVLQGNFNNSFVGGENSLKIRNGIHSMFVVCNANGTLKNWDVYASPVGNDDTGDGTKANPYKTIAGALSAQTAIHGDCDGLTLYLEEGDYDYVGPKFPKKVVTKNRYATVCSAPGTNRENVRIVMATTGGLATKFICMRNLLFVGNVKMRTPNMDSFAWIDGCKATAASHEIGGGFASGAWSMVAFTNCEAYNVRDCFRSGNLAVNCSGRKFSDTPLGQDCVVINCSFDEFIRNSNGDHADVFHWFYTKPGYRENRLIYGLDVRNFSLQGWQVNPIRGGGQQLDNVALVDVRISKDISNVAGSWWYMDTNHLYMKNVNLVDQTLRWKVHGQDEDGKMVLRNVVLEDSNFRSMTWLPAEVILKNTTIG
jgi:hypothetical protein